MTAYEGVRTYYGLKPDFVQELVVPDDDVDTSILDGVGAELLYRPMLENGSSRVMLDFLEESEKFIDHEFEKDEGFRENQKRVERITSYVAGMPESVPEQERYKVWEKYINSFWLVAHMDAHKLSDAIVSSVDSRSTEYFYAIDACLGEAIIDNFYSAYKQAVDGVSRETKAKNLAGAKLANAREQLKNTNFRLV
jgi:hypothetical protein